MRTEQTLRAEPLAIFRRPPVQDTPAQMSRTTDLESLIQEDPEEAKAALKETIVENITSQRPPIGYKVTLLVGDKTLLGRRVTAAEYAEHFKTFLLEASKGEQPDPVLSLLPQVKVDDIKDDDQVLFYFECSQIISMSGNVWNMGNVMLRLRADAIDGLALGTLSLARQPS